MAADAQRLWRDDLRRLAAQVDFDLAQHAIDGRAFKRNLVGVEDNRRDRPTNIDVDLHESGKTNRFPASCLRQLCNVGNQFNGVGARQDLLWKFPEGLIEIGAALLAVGAGERDTKKRSSDQPATVHGVLWHVDTWRN